MNLSPRFSTETPPAHKGVYLTQRTTNGMKFWRAFDGTHWHYGMLAKVSPSYEEAMLNPRISKSMMPFYWRGVEDEPK